MCNSCEALMINGIYCHEHGCPEAWKDYKLTCLWCGNLFMPEYKDQTCCDEDCADAYYN